MPNHCLECGELTPPDSKYCGGCGADLSSENATPDSEELTHQNETGAQSTVATKYGGFWRRFAAYLIDGFVLSAAIMAMVFIAGLVLGVTGAFLGMGTPRSVEAFDDRGYLFDLLVLVVAWLYYAGMESSTNQATVGKMALSMKVTDMSASKITFARATGRFFAKIISGFIFLIGFIMIAFTPKKQGLHDIIAGTVVVKTR